ncbi:hypothetical protein JCM19029_20420 [Salinicoccus sesuvii]
MISSSIDYKSMEDFYILGGKNDEIRSSSENNDKKHETIFGKAIGESRFKI